MVPGTTMTVILSAAVSLPESLQTGPMEARSFTSGFSARRSPAPTALTAPPALVRSKPLLSGRPWASRNASVSAGWCRNSKHRLNQLTGYGMSDPFPFSALHFLNFFIVEASQMHCFSQVTIVVFVINTIMFHIALFKIVQTSLPRPKIDAKPRNSCFNIF